MIAQGNALGQGRDPLFVALQGRTTRAEIAGDSTPFQGFGIGWASVPRALPWAIIVRPFWAGASSGRRTVVLRGPGTARPQ